MARPDYVPSGAEDITDHGISQDHNPNDPDLATADEVTSAIKDAAVAAGAGGSIYVPEGTYFFGNDGRATLINFTGNDYHEPPGISIYGDGPTKSTIAASEHMADDQNHTLFRYGDTDDHGTVEIQHIYLDGNYENLGDLASNATGGSAINPKPNPNNTMDVYNVKCRGWYNEAVDQQGMTGDVEYCTFEESALGAARDADSAQAHIFAEHDTGNEYKVTNTIFKNTSGHAVEHDGNGGDVVVEDCYIEGCGSQAFLANGDLLKVTRVYAKIRNNFTQNEVDIWHGRHLVKKLGGAATTVIELNDVEAEDGERYAIFMDSVDDDLEITNTGDTAFKNFAIGDTYTSCIREEEGSISNVDIEDISVHDTGGDVFDIPSSSGSITTLHRNNNSGLGDPGSITIGTDNTSADPLNPRVPAEGEVGINSFPEAGRRGLGPLLAVWRFFVP